MAIQRGEELLNAQQQSEKELNEWQDLQLAVLEAKQAMIASIKADPKSESKANALNKELRSELQKLSRLQNPVGEKAVSCLQVTNRDRFPRRYQTT